MNDTYTRPLQKILSSITIFSPTSFSLAGQVFQGQAPATPQGPQPPNGQQSPLIFQLQQALYAYAYVQRFAGTSRPPVLAQELDVELSEALSRANTSRERWDTGWQIAQITPAGQVIAQKHGATRSLWPGEFVSHDGPGTPPRVGATITLYMARESNSMQPGFYFAFGETVSEPQDLYEAVRFYWNINVDGAVELTRAVTGRLNRFQTPFRFKCCSHRALFYRLDSAVLYVNKRHCRIVAELLVDVYRALRPHLSPDGYTPLFTRQLAPGLAFAEEPGTGESFGTFCCRVVAEGIWSAYMRGANSAAGRLDAVRRQFESYEIDLERPYLRPGSVDIYDFPTYT